MPLIEDLRIESSNATFNALPLLDFTGGLNLGREGFLLQDNESPDMLNVDCQWCKCSYTQREAMGILALMSVCPAHTAT